MYQSPRNLATTKYLSVKAAPALGGRLFAFPGSGGKDSAWLGNLI